jgi:transcriptional regulator with XRE-family HTH domain
MARKIPNAVDVYVGARIKARRSSMGMSQSKLGAALGLTFQQVQKYEKGMNRVGASRLSQIAKALEVTESYFFEGSPGPKHKAGRPDGSIQSVTTFVSSEEGLRLMRAFMKVPKEVRHGIVYMVERIAENG